MSHDEIARLLQQRVGFDAAAYGRGAIEVAVRKRSAVLGIDDAQTYGPFVSSSMSEFQELVECLVIPETWFFRDSAAFEALTNFVTDEWLPDSARGVLRVLSVPCSTGEEPYSIAIALVEAGLPPDRFHIDAMDISLRALEKARAGVYRKHSFRSDIGGLRERYFTESPVGDILDDSIRRSVEFRHGNLLNLGEHLGPMSYDVIFCRNILIYFDTIGREVVLPQLAAHLTINGLLFVGPAEPYLNTRFGFVTSNATTTFVYRKIGAPGGRDAQSIAAPVGKKTVKKAIAPAQRPAKMAVLAPTPAPPQLTAPSSLPAKPSDLESIIAMADAGQLGEARSRCQEYLAKSGDSPRAFCLMALLEDSLGRSARAIEYYRKAIYLDPNHAEALSHLALLLSRQGDTAQVRHLRDRARRVEERING